MERDEEPGNEAPERKRPSLAFSWATLGFILGALFVLTIPRRAPPPPSAPPPAPAPVVRLARPPLSTIEAVFAEWNQYAVWNNGMTQVALFDGQTKTFSDCYEVVRLGGNDYFRSIPTLTEPVLEHGVPDDSPLEFTETAEQRAEWLRAVNDENWKSIQKSIKENLK